MLRNHPTITTKTRMGTTTKTTTTTTTTTATAKTGNGGDDGDLHFFQLERECLHITKFYSYSNLYYCGKQENPRYRECVAAANGDVLMTNAGSHDSNSNIPKPSSNLVCPTTSLPASCRRQSHSSCGVLFNSNIDSIDPRPHPFAPLPRSHGFVHWAAAMEPALAVVVAWVARDPGGVAVADPCMAGDHLAKVVRA